MNPTGRFSNRVDFYVRYRPGYPDAALDVLEDAVPRGSVVADIGSGTGISSRWLLQSGAKVYGVEPNREMRERAEPVPGFVSVDGTAEATGLADASVDAVVCATAFHWFRSAECRREFERILRPPHAHVALIWNVRKRDASPLQEGYEELIADLATDYKPEWDRRTEGLLETFFGPGGYRSATVPNEQWLDWDGLLGRALSASYMPLPETPGYEAMERRLRDLFAANERTGRVRFVYETAIYWGRLT